MWCCLPRTAKYSVLNKLGSWPFKYIFDKFVRHKKSSERLPMQKKKMKGGKILQNCLVILHPKKEKVPRVISKGQLLLTLAGDVVVVVVEGAGAGQKIPPNRYQCCINQQPKKLPSHLPKEEKKKIRDRRTRGLNSQFMPLHR